MKLFSTKQNSPDVATLIKDGDEARDARQWTKAVSHYESAVVRDPELRDIWVQLGNCRKEAGRINEAEAAYRKSLELDPLLADTYLQLGHVLKLQGRLSEARRSYEKSMELDPGSASARSEAAALQNLSVGVGRRQAAAKGRRLLLDCSDLVQFFMDNRLPTGIQRVQIRIVLSALADQKHEDGSVVVFFSGNTKSWRYIRRLDFIFLTNSAQQLESVSESAWTSIRDSLCGPGAAPAFDFAPGNSLINIGTSWWIDDYFVQVRNLKTAFGVTYIPFVHDCIPLVVPEYCSQGLVKQFRSWMGAVFRYADGFLVNSHSTEADLLRIAAEMTHEKPNVYVIKLDGDIRSGIYEDGENSKEMLVDKLFKKEKIKPQKDRAANFVLCVSTLEIRKNHLILFRVWDSLIDKIGLDQTPYLFCVGKRGWLFDASLAFFEKSAQAQTSDKIPRKHK